MPSHPEVDVLSIVYSSTATRRFTADDLTTLLAQSRAHNEAAGLSGVLVHRDGRFLQLLEGPDDAVRERMGVIERDARHGQVRVLLEDEVEARSFPDWTMGFGSAGDSAAEIPGYRRTFDDIDADRSESGTLPALRALIGWYRGRHDG